MDKLSDKRKLSVDRTGSWLDIISNCRT